MISSVDEYTTPIWKYAFNDHPYSSLARIAAEDLRGVVSAATIPFQLEQDAVHQDRFRRFLTSERILALEKKPSSPEEEAISEVRCRERAQARMAEYIASTEGHEDIIDSIILGLRRHLDSSEILFAAEEILFQAQVAGWSAFESFSREFIIEWLNRNPSQAIDLIGDPSVQKLIGSKALSISDLSDFGFDLTRSMGNIVFSKAKFDSFHPMKKVFKILFDNPKLQLAFGPQLYELNQNRHLIVHRRGIVDTEYLKNTGKELEPGKRLYLTGKDTAKCLFAVQKAIIAILEASTNAASE